MDWSGRFDQSGGFKKEAFEEEPVEYYEEETTYHTAYSGQGTKRRAEDRNVQVRQKKMKPVDKDTTVVDMDIDWDKWGEGGPVSWDQLKDDFTQLDSITSWDQVDDGEEEIQTERPRRPPPAHGRHPPSSEDHLELSSRGAYRPPPTSGHPVTATRAAHPPTRPTSSRDPYAPSARDPYAPPARDPYATSARDPYAPPARDPYVPPARDQNTAPASRDAYAPSTRDPYAPSARDPYVSPSQVARDPYAQASKRDAYPSHGEQATPRSHSQAGSQSAERDSHYAADKPDYRRGESWDRHDGRESVRSDAKASRQDKSYERAHKSYERADKSYERADSRSQDYQSDRREYDRKADDGHRRSTSHERYDRRSKSHERYERKRSSSRERYDRSRRSRSRERYDGRRSKSRERYEKRRSPPRAIRDKYYEKLKEEFSRDRDHDEFGRDRELNPKYRTQYVERGIQRGRGRGGRGGYVKPENRFVLSLGRDRDEDRRNRAASAVGIDKRDDIVRQGKTGAILIEDKPVQREPTRYASGHYGTQSRPDYRGRPSGRGGHNMPPAKDPEVLKSELLASETLLALVEKFGTLCAALRSQEVKDNYIQTLQNACMHANLDIKIEYRVENVPPLFNRDIYTGSLYLSDIFLSRCVGLEQKKLKNEVFKKAYNVLMNKTLAGINDMIDPGLDMIKAGIERELQAMGPDQFMQGSDESCEAQLCVLIKKVEGNLDYLAHFKIALTKLRAFIMKTRFPDTLPAFDRVRRSVQQSGCGLTQFVNVEEDQEHGLFHGEFLLHNTCIAATSEPKKKQVRMVLYEKVWNLLLNQDLDRLIVPVKETSFDEDDAIEKEGVISGNKPPSVDAPSPIPKPSLLEASIIERISGFLIVLADTVQDDNIVVNMENCLINCGITATCVYMNTPENKKMVQCYFFLETFFITKGEGCDKHESAINTYNEAYDILVLTTTNHILKDFKSLQQTDFSEADELEMVKVGFNATKVESNRQALALHNKVPRELKDKKTKDSLVIIETEAWSKNRRKNAFAILLFSANMNCLLLEWKYTLVSSTNATKAYSREAKTFDRTKCELFLQGDYVSSAVYYGRRKARNMAAASYLARHWGRYQHGFLRIIDQDDSKLWISYKAMRRQANIPKKGVEEAEDVMDTNKDKIHADNDLEAISDDDAPSDGNEETNEAQDVDKAKVGENEGEKMEDGTEDKSTEQDGEKDEKTKEKDEKAEENGEKAEENAKEKDEKAEETGDEKAEEKGDEKAEETGDEKAEEKGDEKAEMEEKVADGSEVKEDKTAETEECQTEKMDTEQGEQEEQADEGKDEADKDKVETETNEESEMMEAKADETEDAIEDEKLELDCTEILKLDGTVIEGDYIVDDAFKDEENLENFEIDKKIDDNQTNGMPEDGEAKEKSEEKKDESTEKVEGEKEDEKKTVDGEEVLEDKEDDGVEIISIDSDDDDDDDDEKIDGKETKEGKDDDSTKKKQEKKEDLTIAEQLKKVVGQKKKFKNDLSENEKPAGNFKSEPPQPKEITEAEEEWIEKNISPEKQHDNMVNLLKLTIDKYSQNRDGSELIFGPGFSGKEVDVMKESSADRTLEFKIRYHRQREYFCICHKLSTMNICINALEKKGKPYMRYVRIDGGNTTVSSFVNPNYTRHLK